MLIEPLLSYSRVLKALKRPNSSVKSIEDLILKQSIPFANFNYRFQDKFLLSINALILFEKLELLSIKGNNVFFEANDFDFSNTSLGEAATSRIAAAGKLADIMVKGDASDLYLSLRVQI